MWTTSQIFSRFGKNNLHHGGTEDTEERKAEKQPRIYTDFHGSDKPKSKFGSNVKGLTHPAKTRRGVAPDTFFFALQSSGLWANLGGARAPAYSGSRQNADGPAKLPEWCSSLVWQQGTFRGPGPGYSPRLAESHRSVPPGAYRPPAPPAKPPAVRHPPPRQARRSATGTFSLCIPGRWRNRLASVVVGDAIIEVTKGFTVHHTCPILRAVCNSLMLLGATPPRRPRSGC